MTMKKFFSLLTVGALSLLTMNGAIRVHTIGDSTMAEYEESNSKRGWGMYLGAFFDSNFVTVNNAGHSGRDTRTFYDAAADWGAVKNKMQSGDYLLIQFAHNDEGVHTNGTDNLEYKAYCEANGLTVPSDARGTNPQTTYRDYLRAFIDEAREKGVTPVLVGPICRNNWKNGDISRKGQHDLGDDFSKIEGTTLLEHQSLPASDLSMSYVEAMRIVAEEKNVAFLDLTEATRALYVRYGAAACSAQLFNTGDNTHTNALAANLIAREAAQLMKDAGILAEYISIPTSLSANPTNIAIGETYTGVAQNKEILLSGSGLEPANGTLNIVASENLQVSLDKEAYAANLSLPYSSGNVFQKLYIRATYSESGAQEDSVVLTSGDIRLVIPVTATVITLDGGSAISALWTMLDKPAADAIVEGPISAVLTLNHMMAADSKPDFTDVDGTTGVTLVRYHNADDGGAKTAWPAGEEDENAERYIDFAINAPAAMDIRITKIEMDLSSHSTAVMCCRVRAGVGNEIANGQELVEMRNMTNVTIVHQEWVPTITVPAGETLHVRLLPWHNLGESKSGKYICMRNVKIEGLAFEPGDDPNPQEGINNTSVQAKSRKAIINGQLVIVRPDGSMYNALGSQLK